MNPTEAEERHITAIGFVLLHLESNPDLYHLLHCPDDAPLTCGLSQLIIELIQAFSDVPVEEVLRGLQRLRVNSLAEERSQG